MDIDWKKVSQSPGYISMKKAVTENTQKCNRQKWCKKPDERYQQCFDWAIGRAKHYAHHLGVSLEEILNDWESKRDYSFINYYSNHKFPKIHSNSLKLNGFNGIRKLYKHSFFGRKSRQRRMLQLINETQLQNSIRDPGRKARWGNERKKRAAYFRSIQPSL